MAHGLLQRAMDFSRWPVAMADSVLMETQHGHENVVLGWFPGPRGVTKMRNPLLNAAGVFAACLLSTQALATPQVQLSPSLPSPQSTGTAVNLVATGSDSDPGMLTYRYSVAYRGGLRIVRDYSQDSSFNWAGTIKDGLYLVQVTVRNNTTQQTAKKNLLFQFDSRVAGSQPVVSPTSNPLVALFSAPACAGSLNAA
jgi:hypothetical protein